MGTYTTPKGPHPSGRPIHGRIIKGRPIWRVPDSESNIPRLRAVRQNLNCIGFIHNFGVDPGALGDEIVRISRG